MAIPHSAGLFLLLYTGVLISVAVAMAMGDLRVLLAPFVVIVAGFAVFDFRLLYLLLWASIPISTEVSLGGGFATDLPDEGLMILFFLLSIILLASRYRNMSLRMIFHPISLLLILHVGWIALTTLTSPEAGISFKFLAAKMWYVVVFYFLAYLVVRKRGDARAWFKWMFGAIALTVCVISVRHAMEGFSFDSVNTVLNPFYRNHVSYALILGVFFPFLWFLRRHVAGRYTSLLLCILYLAAIYFAYTRAAYLGLVTAAIGLIVVRLRLTRYVLLVALVTAGVMLANVLKDYRYLDYAPEYERTITHYEFGDLLEATYQREDISTMERFYRWIAGIYMIGEKPLTGFGPGNFYTFYRPYTDENFVTYVSDNPERSGVHNYFLMTAVEQGIPGLLIFIVLLCTALLKAEWLYHRIAPGFERRLLSACICALFFILFVLLLNDMIETDKVGPFFFFCLAMITALELRSPGSENKVV